MSDVPARRRIRLRHAPWFACVAVLAAVPLLQQWPWFVEQVYARAWSPVVCRTLAALTGHLRSA